MKKDSVLDLFWTFFKIGAFTFGGGYAMIAMLERYCVEEKQWVTSDELLNVMIVAESTPGPIAINCSTYTGYKTHGIFGAIVATVANVLPSVVLIYIISLFFENLLSYETASNIFKGISVAVAILIANAGFKMAKKVLSKSPKKKIPILFISVFCVIVLALNILGISFSSIYLMIMGGFCGFLVYKNSPAQMKNATKKAEQKNTGENCDSDEKIASTKKYENGGGL
ncbi:MAG: chromate transporter [Bacillota bacterium]